MHRAACRHLLYAAAVALLAGVATAAPRPQAAILDLAPARQPLPHAAPIAEALRHAGFDVTRLAPDDAGTLAGLDPRRFDVAVLLDGSAMPAPAVGALERYLRAGGDLIALRAPLLRKLLLRDDGRWITRDQLAAGDATRPPEHVLIRYDDQTPTRWPRSTDRPDIHTQVEVVSGPSRMRVLHVTVPVLGGWDTLATKLPQAGFPPGCVLTVFAARGDAHTSTLLVEWDERDGSRWIATVALTPRWRRYVLTPADFKFWHDSRGQRGGAGDCFKPENAAGFSVGVAQSHGCAPGRRHEYWLGPIGTAPATGRYARLLQRATLPPMDTLYPPYKLFASHGASRLETRRDQVFVAAADWPLPAHLRCPHPRPLGGGFDKGRAWRWVPLLEARDAAGHWRGNPVTLTIHAGGEFRGGLWASVGVSDADWYGTPAAVGLVAQLARRMLQPAFLLDGGTNFYTYFEDQPLTLGVRVVNVGDHPAENLTARVTLLAAADGHEIARKTWSLKLSPGEIKRAAEEVRLDSWPAGGLRVVAELRDGAAVIDRVEHAAHVWRPRPGKHFVTAEGGHFVLDGAFWRPHGVNYMPSSGIGVEDRAFFEYWVGARAYHPEVIQRDLEHVRELGFNAVSIFIYNRSLAAQNLLDLLRRLDALGLKANLSLRALDEQRGKETTPMRYLWPKIREIIEYYRLAENDTVFAYDLAWEPAFGSHARRSQWDADWRAWVAERYGSIAAAEQDWDFSAPRDADGRLTNPVGAQLTRDGPWRRYVAAYRRFLDTLLYEKYASARRLVRALDPHHLVSFRMTDAANPTYRFAERIPYDWPFLAAGVDILEPEAYGRIGDWERVRPGWFEREYARWAAPDLPMMWAEAGVSAWSRSRMRSDPEQLAFQGRYYRDLYRMFIASGADGIFFWWYPGGFRVNENSDYGIINPDGSDRPVTRVIREMGPRLLAADPLPPVDHWIEFDRDRHPDGVAGVYDAVRDEFWKAIEQGQVPGLRTAGTGTDSTNCPLVAVGNVPCTGHNPPKYLDGWFDAVYVRGAAGRWTRVENGGPVRVEAAQPLRARIVLTNLAEAAWAVRGRAGGRAGVVDLVVTAGATTRRLPLPRRVGYHETLEWNDVELLPNGTAGVTKLLLRLAARGRTPFGPVFRIRLEPAGR